MKDRNLLSSLWVLAREHGLNFLDPIIPGERIAEVYATNIEDHVVVVLRGRSHWIPGHDTQYLLLLDQDGRIADRLSCAINNRLTRRFRGHPPTFCTDVPPAPETDGARLVVRYSGSVSGNWSHQVTHEGKTHSYYWGQDGPNAGLCRVGVRGGKFVVLFPGPQGGR